MYRPIKLALALLAGIAALPVLGAEFGYRWYCEGPDEWMRTPLYPTSDDTVDIVGSLPSGYANLCEVGQSLGLPVAITDESRRQIRVDMEPEPPGDCPRIWAPVSALQLSFRLPEGQWVVYSSALGFTNAFSIGKAIPPVRIETRTDGSARLVLSWDSTEGREYGLQASTDLREWITILDKIVPAGPKVEVAIEMAELRAFYRVVTTASPVEIAPLVPACGM